MIDYDEFPTESVTVELRYPQAPLLWDETGRIWNYLRNRFPELKIANGVPNQQVFESLNLRTVTELEAMRVQCRGPKPEIRAAEVAQEMFEVCSKRLQLTLVTRLGFRVIKVRKFPTISEAVSHARFIVPPQISEAVDESAKVTALQVGFKHESDGLVKME